MTAPPAPLSAIDPRNLIREAYAIADITIWDCRSIFLDWALGHREKGDLGAEIAALLAHYRAAHPDHPMTEVLLAGLAEAPPPRRRGGRKSRVSE